MPDDDPAKLIDQFIDAIDRCLDQDDLARSYNAPPQYAESAESRRDAGLKYLEAVQVSGRAAKEAHDLSLTIAQAIESKGLDSTCVLNVRACLEDSSGVAKALRLVWPEAKVHLQRMAIRLRNETVPGDGKRRTKPPAPPPVDDWRDVITLIETKGVSDGQGGFTLPHRWEVSDMLVSLVNYPSGTPGGAYLIRSPDDVDIDTPWYHAVTARRLMVEKGDKVLIPAEAMRHLRMAVESPTPSGIEKPRGEAPLPVESTTPVTPPACQPPIQESDATPNQRFTDIIGTFNQLAGRFDDIGRNDRLHLQFGLYEVQNLSAQAGHLLIRTRSLGAFDDDKWWLGCGDSLLKAPLDAARESMSVSSEGSVTFKDGTHKALDVWTICVGSWLALSYAHLMPHDAGQLDWRHLQVTDDAKILAENQRRAEQFRAQYAKVIARVKSGARTLTLDDGLPHFKRPEGYLVRVEDSYSESDWIEHTRMRARVYADACRAIIVILRGLDMRAAPVPQKLESGEGNSPAPLPPPLPSDRGSAEEPPTDGEAESDLEPAHRKAKALYEWAMHYIDGAEDMPYPVLFNALLNDQRCGGEGLPENAATFARYCRAAGVRRNTPRRSRGPTRSVQRACNL